MELLIELDENKANLLKREALRRVLTTSEYARMLLENNFKALIVDESGETLDKALAGIIGLVKSDGQERWSENGGEKFTDYLIQKRDEERSREISD